MQDAAIQEIGGRAVGAAAGAVLRPAAKILSSVDPKLAGEVETVAGKVAEKAARLLRDGVVILRRYHINGEKLKSLRAAEANEGFGKPPYKSGTFVDEYKLTEDQKFVRLYDDENSEQVGRWMMPESEVRGLTPEQIQNKFSLPQPPTMITDVNVPPRTVLRAGEAGPISDWGTGSGIQVQLMERIPETSYTNPRSFP